MTDCPMCALFGRIERNKENTVTNPNKTAIGLIVDRSGSMEACREEATKAINEFIKEQVNQPGDADFWWVQFDTDFEWLEQGGPMKYLGTFELVPRGFTALYDAMGHMIDRMGKDLAALPEGERPGKVIIVTVTDGMENSSREYTFDGLQKLIRQQQEQWNWEFLYLSSEPRSVEAAIRLGVPQVNTITIDPDPKSYRVGTYVMGQTVSAYRGTGTVKVEDNDLRGKVKSDD